MTPTSPVTPAVGHVYNVHNTLMAVLDIDESTRYQSETEDVREMRFVLRKFVFAVVGLAESNSSDKEEYRQAARKAGSSRPNAATGESIGMRTAETLCKILDDAPWGLEKGLAQEQQQINVSLKGMRDGVKVTLDTLTESLNEYGTGPIEYDGEQSTSAAPKTPTKSRREGSVASTPPRTAGTGQGNRGHGPARKWTDEENVEMLRVVRDVDGTHEERRTEFNRRMAARGISAENERSDNGWRLQLRKLANAGTTIEDLAQALGMTEGQAGDG